MAILLARFPCNSAAILPPITPRIRDVKVAYHLPAKSSYQQSIAKAMLRARLKKYLPTPGRIKSLPPFHYLGIRFNDPLLWMINRNTISRAAAIGLFCAYLPMPMEMLPAALLAMLWRANLPLSIVLVWLSNPFTWIVIYTPPYLLGSVLLGETGLSISHITLQTMMQELAALWLGCLIFGIALACAAYFAVRMVWRMVIINQRDKRRMGVHADASTEEGK